MMKKNIAILGLVVILGLTFSSCEKEPSFNYPDGKVGISKVTVYPIVTLKGERVIVLVKGTAFVDPGVTALEGTNSLTPVVTGSVDVNTAGVYTITYTATNKDGFPAATSRTVAVYDTMADAAANDFSGSYVRGSNGQVAVWTKLAPGVYSVVNPGGAVGASLSVIVFNQTGTSIKIPQQNASDGTSTSSANESYSLATSSFSWVINNPGYGPSLRSFVKQ
ncbi:DUF5011 domain-containing protein [Pedobacter sp. PAMC26386]|nr:DUF5011 domain-containing protein [Pedobacter sp. PAMC26386]